MPGCVECESQNCFGAVPRMQLYEAIQDASDRLDRAHAALLCLSWVNHLESWLEDNLWLEFRMDGFDGLSQIPKFPKASNAWVEWPVSDDTVKSKRFGTGFSTTRSRPAQYCPRPRGGSARRKLQSSTDKSYKPELHLAGVAGPPQQLTRGSSSPSSTARTVPSSPFAEVAALSARILAAFCRLAIALSKGAPRLRNGLEQMLRVSTQVETRLDFRPCQLRDGMLE